jgi:hypothetical protein
MDVELSVLIVDANDSAFLDSQHSRQLLQDCDLQVVTVQLGNTLTTFNDWSPPTLKDTRNASLPPSFSTGLAGL